MNTAHLDNMTLGELQRQRKTQIAQHGRRPVSWADLDTILEDSLRDRLALEQRVAALEARPAAGVEYAGTHEVGKAYPAGQLVTKGGGLWLSLRATNQTPGMDPLNWKLIVKSGTA